MLSPKKKKNVLPPKDVELDNNNNNKWFTFYKEKFGSPTRNTSSRNNKLLFQRSFELATLLPSREKGVAHSSSPSELKKRICSMKRSDSSTVLPPAFKRIPSYEEERKKNPVRVLGGAGGSNRDRKPSGGHNISPKTLDRDLNNSDARGRSSGNAKEVDSNYFQSSSAYGRGDPGLAKDLPAAGRPSGSSVTIGSNVARDLYKQFESLPSHQAEIFQPPPGRRRSISSSAVSTPPYPEGSITYRNHLQTTSSSSSKVRKPSHSSTGFGYTNPNEGRGASPPSGEESSSESSTESLGIAGSTSSQSNRIVRDEPKNDDKSSCSSSGSISPLPLGSRMAEMKLLNPDQQQQTRGPSTTNDKPKFASSSIRRPSYSNSFTRAGSSSSSGMQRDSGGNRSTHYTGSGVHGLVGLVNEGNTCYLNSCLQCLAHSMPLASAVQGPVNSLVQRQGSGSRAGTSERDFSSLAEVLSHAFRQVVRDLWQRPAFTTTRARAFLQCVQAWAPQFAGHSQHDAQEVLRAILDGLHEALNRVTTAPPYRDLYLEPKPEDELAELTWRYHKLCQDSIIQDIFCGQLQSTIECCTCHRKSHCFDPFHDLSLPLPRESSIRDPFRGGNSQPRVTLHDCLSAFVAPEQLEGSNKYYCPSCKRFYKSERFSYQKDDTPVYYPLEGLDFTDFLSARARKIRRTGVVYDLYGVCCHMGSLGCGHYTAQCKNCENELWYCFNDSSVTPLHDAFSSSAYILFYQQQS